MSVNNELDKQLLKYIDENIKNIIKWIKKIYKILHRMYKITLRYDTIRYDPDKIQLNEYMKQSQQIQDDGKQILTIVQQKYNNQQDKITKCNEVLDETQERIININKELNILESDLKKTQTALSERDKLLYYMKCIYDLIPEYKKYNKLIKLMLIINKFNDKELENNLQQITTEYGKDKKQLTPMGIEKLIAFIIFVLVIITTIVWSIVDIVTKKNKKNKISNVIN